MIPGLAIFFTCTSLFAQTSDDQFRLPLKVVLNELQLQYGITIRYPEELVKDKWVSYARWRYRPDIEKTLGNILSSQDLTFSKEGEKRYKLQAYQYHLKTPEEGVMQLQWFSSLYNDLDSWSRRKDSLKKCILSTLRLENIPAAPSSKPVLSAIRKYAGYSVQNIAIESLPGVYVCGSIYRPLKAKGKLPVILNPDGHFSRGRYRADCQYRCAMQAKMGAIAVSYDLFGWEGESILQIDPKDHRRSLVQSIQVLNTLRILDFMLELKEADASRVAITGASGGGSQTMLMTAIDERIKLSVPVAMLSSFHSGGCPCESGMGIHLCGGGTNNVEIASMAAPRPQLVISDGMDWTKFVPQNEFPFLQTIYGFYGKPSLVINVHLETEGHDYGFSKRKAMYEFIAGSFGLKLKQVKNKSGVIDETGVIIEKENELKSFGENGERLPVGAVKGLDAITKIFENAVSKN